MNKKYIALFALVMMCNAGLQASELGDFVMVNYDFNNDFSSRSGSSQNVSREIGLTPEAEVTSKVVLAENVRPSLRARSASNPESRRLAETTQLKRSASSSNAVSADSMTVGLSEPITEKQLTVESKNPELQSLELNMKEQFGLSNVGGSNERRVGSSIESSNEIKEKSNSQSKKSTISPRAAAVKAAQIVTEAFANMDYWINRSGNKNSIYHTWDQSVFDALPDKEKAKYDETVSRYSEIRKNNVVDARKLSKIDMANKYMNEALENIRVKINVQSMQPIKEKFNTALKSFATQSNIDNVVLRKMVDSVKIVLMIPVKVAVQAGIGGAGMALGAVGGAGAGLGAGINRTAKWMNKTNIRNQKGNISMVEVAKAIPITIGKALVGVVGTPALAAYSAVEGLAIGGIVGAEQATKITGTKLFTLHRNYAAESGRKQRAQEAKEKAVAAKKAVAEKRHIGNLSAKQSRNLQARSEAALANPNRRAASAVRTPVH